MSKELGGIEFAAVKPGYITEPGNRKQFSAPFPPYFGNFSESKGLPFGPE
jgi:hypothetical protein